MVTARTKRKAPIIKNGLKWLLLAPPRTELQEVRRALEDSSKEAGAQLVLPEVSSPTRLNDPETLSMQLASVDLVVALISQNSSNVFYEVGRAHGAGKPVVFVGDDKAPIQFLPLSSTLMFYDHTSTGLTRLQTNFRQLLIDFQSNPRRFQLPQKLALPTALPIIDLDRLDPREFENLCFELLTQMGFRRVEWGKELKEIDVVASLPKKDPDGFEYDELWLISMGLHFPPAFLFESVADPEFFLHRILRPQFLERFRKSFRPDTPITLLLISARETGMTESLEYELKHLERRMEKQRYGVTFRVRLWDRKQLINLIQQYPQIAYKYFSEEGRSQSKYRKSPEEFYRETVHLNESLQIANTALKDEREKRVRAERDAVWKEVAFKAAHKLGNPVFAIETGLQGIRRRIKKKPDEALAVADEMDESVEKAKAIIEQFKSLTRAQEITPRSVDLIPLLESASHVASENGVEVKISTPGRHPKALADPVRMAECFDELFANALHWLDKEGKRISVVVDIAKNKDLPASLTDSRRYVRIRFEDNGSGVPLEEKIEIFSPFFTTRTHGTGLGLSLVQRVIEGHNGAMRENGTHGEGAVFEIFIPQATKKDKEA